MKKYGTLPTWAHSTVRRECIARDRPPTPPPHLDPLDTRASPEPGLTELLPLPAVPGLEDPPAPQPPPRFLDSSSFAMSLCNCRTVAFRRIFRFNNDGYMIVMFAK